jgi:hypothetical protein
MLTYRVLTNKYKLKGALGSFLCLLFGFVLMNIGVMTGIIFLLMTALANCIFMITWTPNPAKNYVIFLIVIGFAFSHSISNSQIRGIIWNKVLFLK